MNWLKLNAIFSTNIFLVIILIIFQGLTFAFMYAIDPSLSTAERHTEAINYVLSKSVVLAIEAIIGLVVIFFINQGMMKSKKRALIITLIDFTILVVSATLFSLNYINKF